jgi:zinc finger protein AEBP2
MMIIPWNTNQGPPTKVCHSVARMFDFIDSGIMEGLQHKLLTMTQHRTMGQIHDAGNAVNVHSQVMARRVEPDGKVKFLIKWDPVGM